MDISKNHLSDVLRYSLFFLFCSNEEIQTCNDNLCFEQNLKKTLTENSNTRHVIVIIEDHK